MAEVKKYVKKPVQIEAIQFTNNADIEDFCGGMVIKPIGKNLLIITTRGTKELVIGDYVIKNANLDYDVCKPDIFEQSYQEVK